MNIKKVAALCRSEKCVTVYDRKSEQWIGTRGAAYPCTGLPYLTDKAVMAILDINDKQQEKMVFARREPPSFLGDFEQPGEEAVRFPALEIEWMGNWYRPYLTSDILTLVDVRYLAPLYGIEGLTFEAHRQIGGQLYIVAKRGFLPEAIILPRQLDDDIVTRLSTLASKARLALTRAEARRTAQAEGAEQTGLDFDGEPGAKQEGPPDCDPATGVVLDFPGGAGEP